jgi:NodT family efflux transporter outer membrane factor (OMF) lipoprotein
MTPPPPSSRRATGVAPAATHRGLRALAAVCTLLLAAGCASRATEPSPARADPPAWRETVPGWMSAAPADTLSRGAWWSLFGDPGLDALVPQVAVSNQTVAGASAALDAARAAERAQRAGFFPTLGLDAGATRSGTRADPPTAGNAFRLGVPASWEPDLWGRVSTQVDAAGARVRASEADLAAATLAAQGAFVTDYLGLREADAEIALLTTTIDAWGRALQITQHRYDAGLAPRTDVLQAQTQVANAESALAGVQRQRAQLLHALAVLAGRAPSAFDLPAGTWDATTVPAVPPGVPSRLLQRRPDIAAAQRRMAAANADVGVARSAWYPALTLSGSVGQGAPRLADLLKASATTWSFGLAVAGTVFDGGLRRAQVDAARASWRQAVAGYRQTTLAAFQEVEDDLSAAETLQRQEASSRVAAQAASQTEEKQLNRYRQGQASYGDVVTAQISALSAKRALLQASLSRQSSSVQLILALGGGWAREVGALR